VTLKQRPSALNAPAIDSNRCAIAYQVRSLRDVPARFQVPEADRAFQSGLFLPREQPDWLGKSSYAARVVLLSARALVILTHPYSKAPAVRIPLQDLLFFETGHNTHRGWLRFVEKGIEHRLHYERHCDRAVGEFLRAFREAYLPGNGLSTIAPGEFGEAPDLKFDNAERFELLPGERVLFQFFSPAAKGLTTRWIFPWESWTASDLLAVTSRRVLWITDRVEGRYDFYATVTRSAPAETLSELSVESADEDCALSIKFSGGALWSASLPMGRQADALRFVEAVTRFLERLAGYNKSSAPGLGGEVCLVTRL
jgi:hypothetical protein